MRRRRPLRAASTRTCGCGAAACSRRRPGYTQQATGVLRCLARLASSALIQAAAVGCKRVQAAQQRLALRAAELCCSCACLCLCLFLRVSAHSAGCLCSLASLHSEQQPASAARPGAAGSGAAAGPCSCCWRRRLRSCCTCSEPLGLSHSCCLSVGLRSEKCWRRRWRQAAEPLLLLLPPHCSRGSGRAAEQWAAAAGPL